MRDFSLEAYTFYMSCNVTFSSFFYRDAQRIVEEKQKRIDDAHKALQLLRTACIVWPNSASEVLVAGSFDGWATQVIPFANQYYYHINRNKP